VKSIVFCLLNQLAFPEMSFWDVFTKINRLRFRREESRNRVGVCATKFDESLFSSKTINFLFLYFIVPPAKTVLVIGAVTCGTSVFVSKPPHKA